MEYTRITSEHVYRDTMLHTGYFGRTAMRYWLTTPKGKHKSYKNEPTHKQIMEFTNGN